MIIDLARVGQVSKPIRAEFSGYEVDLGGDGRLIDTARFRGEVFGNEAGAQIEGMIAATVESDCTRCLEPVRRSFEIPFTATYVDAGRETRERETELDLSDLDESLVTGGSVDLAEVVREQILIALPSRILCGEECRGLCAKCGGNRNLIDCSCPDDEPDPRWVALKDLTE
jgi:uncharacterized protein